MGLFFHEEHKFYVGVGAIVIALLFIGALWSRSRGALRMDAHRNCGAADANQTIKLIVGPGDTAAESVRAALHNARCAGRVYVTATSAVKAKYTELALARNDAPLHARLHEVDNLRVAIEEPAQHRFLAVIDARVQLHPGWDDMAIQQLRLAEPLAPGANAPVLTAAPAVAIPFTNIPVERPPHVHVDANQQLNRGVLPASGTHTPVPADTVLPTLLFGKRTVIQHLLDSLPRDTTELATSAAAHKLAAQSVRRHTTPFFPGVHLGCTYTEWHALFAS